MFCTGTVQYRYNSSCSRYRARYQITLHDDTELQSEVLVRYSKAGGHAKRKGHQLARWYVCDINTVQGGLTKAAIYIQWDIQNK